jgi:hypothetical protein
MIFKNITKVIDKILNKRGQNTDPSRSPELSRQNGKITRNTYTILRSTYVPAKPADISIGKPKSCKFLTDSQV